MMIAIYISWRYKIIEFITGLFIGGLFGVSMMCLFKISKKDKFLKELDYEYWKKVGKQ